MRSFEDLFKGREDAHGYYGNIRGVKPTDRGKITSVARSVREPLTPELWKLHLEGKKRLGIIPVMKDAKVWWFCIDVDHYQDTGLHEQLAEAILTCGLPLVMTRSKSNGAHLWCFLEEPMPASRALEIAKAFGKKLDIPEDHVDYFPKDADPTNFNFWVNLPYFGDTCRATGEDGRGDLILEEFLEFANDRITHPSDLAFKQKEKASVKKDRPVAPPCIDYMIENGVEEGNRDLAMYQFIVYAKRRWPDEWKEKAVEFNEASLHPPLRRDELNKSFKSHMKKDYEYQCKAMKAIFCDANACKKRQFGIGSEEEIEVPIESIEKIDGEVPIYRVALYGKTFTCQVPQLFNANKFRELAFSQCDRFVPAMKQFVWEEILTDHMEKMARTTPAVDTEMRDRVISEFQKWCQQFTVTSSLDDALAARAPYYKDQRIYFSGDAFMTIIDRNLKIARDRVFVYMRGWNVSIVQYEGHTLWCWIQNGPLWFEPDKGKQA